MYNGSYSQANFGLAAKKIHKSKGKSCGYYMKLVFFFSSLIQSLIIASLVLFLVYGQPEHTVEEKRLQELDQSVGKLTMENYILREKQKNLTKYLNLTLTAKKSSDKDLFELRKLANISFAAIKSMQMKLSQYEMEKRIPPAPRLATPTHCPDPNEINNQLRFMLQKSDEMLQLVKANFTQKMDYMKSELETSNKDKDLYHLEAIQLRRDKAYLQEELELYQKKCKEDFVESLQGIPNVTKEFLKRIDDLFSKHISFQLTCDKQKRQLENIRENCSSLSREVENKLQSYLDIVGNQFTRINGENSKYVTENKRFREDADRCNQNRSAMVQENRRVLDQIQLKHDDESKRLLMENKKLKGDNRLKEDLLSVKEKDITMLTLSVKTLNTSLANCKPPLRTPFGPNPYGMPNIPSAGGSGPSSSGLSRPTGNIGSAGTGLTAFNSAASSGAGLNKPGGGVGFGSLGSNTPGFGMTLGGGRTSGSDSALLNPAQISNHLRELHRYSVTS